MTFRNILTGYYEDQGGRGFDGKVFRYDPNRLMLTRETDKDGRVTPESKEFGTESDYGNMDKWAWDEKVKTNLGKGGKRGEKYTESKVYLFLLDLCAGMLHADKKLRFR